MWTDQIDKAYIAESPIHMDEITHTRRTPNTSNYSGNGHVDMQTVDGNGKKDECGEMKQCNGQHGNLEEGMLCCQRINVVIVDD